MFDYFGLSQKLTQIYFSDLRFKLKNDCVCRLIAQEAKGLSCVSILLYDASVDKLVNYGHYLDPSQILKTEGVDGELYKTLLENISIFEYFAYRYESNSLEKCSFKDYNAISFFKSNKINKDKYETLTSFFLGDREKQKDFISKAYSGYKSYKKTIFTNDSYDLRRPAYPSGDIFSKLIKSKHSTNKKPLKEEWARDRTNKDRFLNDLYTSKLKIYLKPYSSYKAIPLYVSDRYIGIIRFLWKRPDNTDLGYNSSNSFLKYKVDDLAGIASLIAYHIGNTYSVHEFKLISYEKIRDSLTQIESDILESDILNKNIVSNYFSDFCESLRKTINCRASIIRLESDRPSATLIKGWTKTVNKYVENIIFDDHFKKNIDDLNLLFNPQTPRIKDGREIDIFGVKLNLRDFKAKKIEYLYFTGDEILNTISDIDAIDKQASNIIYKVFEAPVFKKLSKYNIHEIIIIRIPYIECGYITFANTIFYPFTSGDINIIYPQINRLGSELFIRKSSFFQNLAFILSELDHELRTPFGVVTDLVRDISNKVKRLVESENPEPEMKAIIGFLKSEKGRLLHQVEDVLEHIKQKLALVSFAIDFNRNAVREEVPEAYYLQDFLYSHIKQHRVIAAKRRKLGIIRNWLDDCNKITIKINTKFLSSIIILLLDNAIKYSFEPEQRKKFVKSYSQDFKTKKTDGHIKVDCFSNNDGYGFSITNWGKEIFSDELEKIKKHYFRGKTDPDFNSNKEFREGRGSGLAYVQKYSENVGAQFVITSEGKKTTMTIKWQLQENHINS